MRPLLDRRRRLILVGDERVAAVGRDVDRLGRSRSVLLGGNGLEDDRGSGVVILADLGSAVLSALTAVDELLDPGRAARTRISGGPMVTTSTMRRPLLCMPSRSIASSGVVTKPCTPTLPSLVA